MFGTACKLACGWPSLLSSHESVFWVLNSCESASGRLFLLYADHRMVLPKDVLQHADWTFITNIKTFQNVAFLCIATAIIAEDSFFLWKQNPSSSPEVFTTSMETFKSSADLPKIWNAIQNASPLKDKTLSLWRSALVQIAQDNLLCM
ncbi:hypothetical protein K443DRAFT_102167 [Laccaria amethystina LaAM-08-1]|uniref:Uncharacterized protein n=1 Tax=Laccaria amethystina LaAM-08-1 TaxID=1095629 RepID=A0A0C9WNZ8_9AGAR|nr:hypothetical protein K443DRAFT_102167 [Laccaria amethystina LaAM-08-1]